MFTDKHSRRQTIIALLTVMVVSGCETMQSIKTSIGNIELPKLETAQATGTGNCPEVKIVDDLQSIFLFQNAGSTADDNLVSRMDITNAYGKCTYNSGSVAMEIDVTFAGLAGPKARKYADDAANISNPYFAAVVSPDGSIVLKDVFSVSTTFEPQQAMLETRETLRQTIPLDSASEGKEYKVLIGFQLNESQLRYNRENAVKIKADVPVANAPATPAQDEPAKTIPTKAAQPGIVMSVDTTTAPMPQEKPQQTPQQTPDEVGKGSGDLFADFFKDAQPPELPERD